MCGAVRVRVFTYYACVAVALCVRTYGQHFWFRYVCARMRNGIAYKRIFILESEKAESKRAREWSEDGRMCVRCTCKCTASALVSATAVSANISDSRWTVEILSIFFFSFRRNRICTMRTRSVALFRSFLLQFLGWNFFISLPFFGSHVLYILFPFSFRCHSHVSVVLAYTRARVCVWESVYACKWHERKRERCVSHIRTSSSSLQFKRFCHFFIRFCLRKSLIPCSSLIVLILLTRADRTNRMPVSSRYRLSLFSSFHFVFHFVTVFGFLYVSPLVFVCRVIPIASPCACLFYIRN